MPCTRCKSGGVPEPEAVLVLYGTFWYGVSFSYWMRYLLRMNRDHVLRPPGYRFILPYSYDTYRTHASQIKPWVDSFWDLSRYPGSQRVYCPRKPRRVWVKDVFGTLQYDRVLHELQVGVCVDHEESGWHYYRDQEWQCLQSPGPTIPFAEMCNQVRERSRTRHEGSECAGTSLDSDEASV